MARYTARHAYRPSEGHAYKRPAYKYDQPKSQHDKPSAVRRLTALAAAAAALIGGGYLGHQHYQSREKNSTIAAQPTSGELAAYTEVDPFTIDPKTGELHCANPQSQEVKVAVENSPVEIANSDGTVTRASLYSYTTNQGSQGRTIVTVEYPQKEYTEKERREAGQIPFAIKVDGGHINTTTEPDTIGYTGSAVRISEDTTGIGREAVACLPPHKPQPTPPSR